MDQAMVEVRLNEDGVARYNAAADFWESYAGWNKCFDDERMKAAFIAGYVMGWDQNKIPPPPAGNIIPANFAV